ncbi:hypothetical protein CONCODRAFT_15887 [Conidiobolus coronatus NRRL 28638]|uniref:Uncharacterized protein n=1 Tax=Conidiobolus coronatus (strain ATCC 28846 / CBS 209.66 / NRRL 28638) TaxID=796925 RepID=A0A137PCZ1_CONC2|nr:hypothetical protein CONCODRAFT_15887 [Conidiobolus coronatus NRRL 28638]|eukprot:KXN72867.1 hypothetical protein CONCODRAFT_15887 [Conidiobolus coronatus NRRL 28638]
MYKSYFNILPHIPTSPPATSINEHYIFLISIISLIILTGCILGYLLVVLDAKVSKESYIYQTNDKESYCNNPCHFVTNTNNAHESFQIVYQRSTSVTPLLNGRSLFCLNTDCNSYKRPLSPDNLSTPSTSYQSTTETPLTSISIQN